MKKLITYLKELGASTVKLIHGPNGAFIVYIVNGQEHKLPVGKKSQAGTLSEFNILIAEDGQAIATVNQYKQVEELELA
tara:strand:- start:850 stop:1086 length:237 start_codon:yes stop_codon:yes gene_type:complete